jgi:hypothetical protein
LFPVLVDLSKHPKVLFSIEVSPTSSLAIAGDQRTDNFVGGVLILCRVLEMPKELCK